MIRIASMAALAIASATLASAAVADEISDAEAYFSFVTEAVIAGGVPDVPDDPVDDQCENCNGTGKVGDGTVMRVCPVCDGTGKRVDRPAYLRGETGTTVIHIFSSDRCPPCRRWEAVEYPKLYRRGFRAFRVKGHDRPITPTFQFEGITIEGYTTAETIIELVEQKKAAAKTTATSLWKPQVNVELQP